ncbi:MAG: NTP transferase domain-containing protein [Elainellaceae cyanobacterium]
MSVGLIVLAAGASTRLGEPKQLLRHREHSLLRTTLETAIASVCDPVAVVLGAYAEQIQPEVPQSATVLRNPQWDVGMGTSICCGVQWLEAHSPDAEAIVLLVCDQPFVTTALVNQLVNAHRATRKAIAASAYSGTVGVPALFDRSLFLALKRLSRQGAKPLLARHPDAICAVPFPEGAVDIDTSADVQRWLS